MRVSFKVTQYGCMSSTRGREQAPRHKLGNYDINMFLLGCIVKLFHGLFHPFNFPNMFCGSLLN